MIRHALIVLVAILTTIPAGADWIISNDGDRIRTRGAWEVQGRVVVFELPDGKLVSMPLSEVDLEASAAATQAALKPVESRPADKPEPPAEAVMVLTDADVEHVEPGHYAGNLDSRPVTGVRTEEETTAEPPPTDADGRLEVTSWDHTLDNSVDGTLVTGLLANTSREAAVNIELTMRFFDHEEALLGEVPAILTASTLLPGQTARFRIEATGIFAFTSTRFSVSSLGLETRSDAEEPEPAPADAG